MARKTRSDMNVTAHAKGDAKRAMKLAKAKFNAAQAHVSKYMKDNPVKAAMIAAGIGAAIGAATVALIRRGKGREKKSE